MPRKNKSGQTGSEPKRQPTEKQAEIAGLISDGLTIPQIADHIGQPERVVKAQISRLRSIDALPTAPLRLASPPAPVASSSAPAAAGSVEAHIAAELDTIDARLGEIATNVAELVAEKESLDARRSGLTGAAEQLEAVSGKAGSAKPPLAAVG